MGKSACVQTVAIDNNKTKVVWTRIQNQPGFIAEDYDFPAGGRCVRGAVDNSTGEFTLSTIGDNSVGVIVDTTKHLMWISEHDASKKACLAVHAFKDAAKTILAEDYNKSKGFCSALNDKFPSDTVWRDPTAAELENFVKRTNAVHILPGYEAPCKAVLARDANGSETAISTRFDSTKTVGSKRAFEPYKYNIGLRCVRTVTP